MNALRLEELYLQHAKLAYRVSKMYKSWFQNAEKLLKIHYFPNNWIIYSLILKTFWNNSFQYSCNRWKLLLRKNKKCLSNFSSLTHGYPTTTTSPPLQQYLCTCTWGCNVDTMFDCFNVWTEPVSSFNETGTAHSYNNKMYVFMYYDLKYNMLFF